MTLTLTTINQETDSQGPATPVSIAGHSNHSKKASSPKWRLQVPLPDRYTTATDNELEEMIVAAKAMLGDKLLILGHHYQREEVYRHADAHGDSFKLARFAQERHDAEAIVFLGVHFMAESAAVLTGEHQHVYLPDVNAGCSMADMADIEQVEEAWGALGEHVDTTRIVPITYMNSAAALKAFVGEHGGSVCTSSNARAVLEWALAKGDKVLFFPDQHLGRNTAYDMGYTEDDMALWDPRHELGGLDVETINQATMLLWRGWCSVHQRFKPAHIEAFRAEHPDGVVVAHPECSHDVVLLADKVGSTERIVEWARDLPRGQAMAIGTEVHLVSRLAEMYPDKTIVTLDPLICPCATMFRIDAPHLAWCLEKIIAGEPVNEIVVDESVAQWSKVALERMLSIT